MSVRACASAGEEVCVCVCASVCVCECVKSVPFNAAASATGINHS